MFSESQTAYTIGYPVTRSIINAAGATSQRASRRSAALPSLRLRGAAGGASARGRSITAVPPPVPVPGFDSEAGAGSGVGRSVRDGSALTSCRPPGGAVHT